MRRIRFLERLRGFDDSQSGHVCDVRISLLHRLLDETQRIGERVGELRRHHVVAQRLLGLGHAGRQLQDEVALVHALGNLNQVLTPDGESSYFDAVFVRRARGT